MPSPPKLVVLSEQLRGQQFELSQDLYTIGRSEKEAICINDPTISSRHCELIRDEDGSFRVRDLGSTNGTRINGVKVTEQKLVNSDILQVGGVEIMFDNEGDESVGSQIKTKTQIKIDEKVELRKDISSLSRWNRSRFNSPGVKLLFRIGMIAMILIVLVLLFFLAKMVFF